MIDENVSKNFTGRYIGILRLAVLLCFLPYFQPFPFPTDVQPAGPLLCLLFVVMQRKIKISIFIFATICLALLSFISLFLSPYLHGSNNFWFVRKALGVMLLVPVVMILPYMKYVISKRMLWCVLWIYIAGGIIELAIPNAYNSLVPYFVNFKEMEFGIRGVRSLAPEPTDLGFVIFCCLITYQSISDKNSRGREMAFTTLCISLMLLTISTLSYLCIIVYFAFRYGLIYLGSFAAILFMAFPLILSMDLRPVDLIVNLVSNPKNVIEYSSAFYRYIDNYASLNYFRETLGVPMFFGSSENAYLSLVSNNAFWEAFPSREWYASELTINPPIAFKNVFSSAIIDFGIFGIVWIFVAFRQIHNYSSVMRTLKVAAFLIFIAQSFPFLFPPIYLATLSRYRFGGLVRRASRLQS